MNDNFHRPIDYLRISVTDRCNLRCFYCMPENGMPLLTRDHILSYEEIREVVKAALALGINKFRITGGEPLLRKGLVEFIYRLNKLKGLEDISLTTNGIELKEYARALYQAGLKRINISLDTLNKNKFKQITREGDLTDVLAGIEEARAVGFFPIKINVVLIRGINDDEILDFARLAFDKPLTLRFIELMPIGQSRFFAQEKIVPGDEVRQKCQLLGKLELTEQPKGNGPAEYYKINRGQGKVGFITAITNPFCSRCNRLRLTANGYLKPCLNYEAKIDLKPGLRPVLAQEKIISLIKKAIKAKPQRHNMAYREETCSRQNLRSMSEIGG